MIASLRALLVAALCMVAVMSPARASADDDQMISYKVKQGDTLFGLSDRYFVGRSAAAEVARLNNISDPNRIGVGKTLRIPSNLLKFDKVILRVRDLSGPSVIAGRPASKGAVLSEGDWVETRANGFITFVSDRGAVVSLPSNTRAQLKRAKQYRLESTLDVDFHILRGRGEVVAPKLRGQERFRVRTPLAVTAVRGTEFRVAHNEDTQVSVAEVTEGSVAVAAADQTALAQSGYGVPMSDAGVGPAEPLLPAPQLADPSKIQTDQDIRFGIVPLDGASFYRTQIAADAGFREIVSEDVSSSADAGFEGLPNGTYFVRSRGVSQTGVEGFSEIYSFKRKRLGASAQAVLSLLEDGLKFIWLAEGAEGGSFAFQLWDENTPGQPILDEVGITDGGFVITGLEPGTYVWRVAATQVDSEGLLKVWTPEQRLHVTE